MEGKTNITFEIVAPIIVMIIFSPLMILMSLLLERSFEFTKDYFIVVKELVWDLYKIKKV